MKIYLKLVFFFLIGLVFLNAFSIIQKVFIIHSLDFILNPKAYVVPSLFGGLSGLIIGLHGMKIQDLNKQLQNRVNNLEKIIPICSICKKICENPLDNEEDRNWIDVTEHLWPQKMSHGFCPDCFKEQMKQLD